MKLAVKQWYAQSGQADWRRMQILEFIDKHTLRYMDCYANGTFEQRITNSIQWAGDPKNLTVYSAYASLTDTDKAVNFNNGSQFVGSVVAPDGLVYLDNTSQVRGAAAGKWIRMDNNSRIRYPQCWENGANLKEFERLSWNQLR